MPCRSTTNSAAHKTSNTCVHSELFWLENKVYCTVYIVYIVKQPTNSRGVQTDRARRNLVTKKPLLVKQK